MSSLTVTLSSSIILCSFGTNSNLNFWSCSQTSPSTQEILQRGPCASHLQKSREVARLAAVDRPFQPSSSFANYAATRLPLCFVEQRPVHACLLPSTMAQISYCMAARASWQILALRRPKCLTSCSANICHVELDLY